MSRYVVRYRPASGLSRNVELGLHAGVAAATTAGAGEGAGEAGFGACDVVVAWNYSGGVLTVTVTDPEGNPVGGAIVTATPVES